MKNLDLRPLFILEMANNHMGSVDHGLRIVHEMRDAVKDFPFNFAIKLQYRDIDNFIHPDYRQRFDLKYVKRFSETALSWDQYRRIKDEINACGMLAICTPWDEYSVEKIEEHGYDFIKIPSCYWSDWPLLERIVKSHLPAIGSVGGATLEDIDRVVSFFKHRDRPLAVMHCVGEYPTDNKHLQLNQIALLKERYPDTEIGYSTHEPPENCDAVKIAIGLGATIFEKHVGVATDTIKLNPYSADPGQVRKWLEAAAMAIEMCGIQGQRQPFPEEELRTLRALQRGVFAKRPIAVGQKLREDDVFFAIPNSEGQIVANDFSKYANFHALEPMAPKAPAVLAKMKACNSREQVYRIIGDVKKILKKAKVVVPGQMELEISHHYGIDEFQKFGSTTITVVNREYCKRVIVLLPGQTHPEQWHEKKDETYHILHGEITLTLDGRESVRKANEVVVIPCGVRHGLSTRSGTVIEEVSSNYSQGDSYYTDDIINQNQNRKTYVTHWME